MCIANIEFPDVVIMNESLQNKLASLVEYLDQVTSGKRPHDSYGLAHALDDPEIQNWLTQMRNQGKADTNNFLRKRST